MSKVKDAMQEELDTTGFSKIWRDIEELAEELESQQFKHGEERVQSED